MTLRTVRTALLLGLAGLLVRVEAAEQARGGATQASLNRTADAILALKSTRFSLKREGAPAVMDEKSGLTFTTADCIYAAPDRVSCNVKVSLKNGTIVQLTRVWVPEGTFQTNPLTKQWAKVPPDANFNGAVLFAKTGIPEILRTGVQNAQVVGPEKVQNQQALHLKGEVRGDKLSALIGTTLKPDAMYPVDLWIDEKTANPAQLHVDEGGGNGWLIELTGHNQPADVPTPQLPPPPPGRQ